MKLGKVVASVTATRKSPRLIGFKLLAVQFQKPDGSLEKDYAIAIDAVGAGTGETVLTVTGSSAREDEMTKKATTDTTIIAIVDAVEMDRVPDVPDSVPVSVSARRS